MKDSYDISNQPEIFKWWSWSWGHFYGISMAFLTPPMTPHPMTGTSLGPEARLLVYFHWAFPCAATAGWEFVHKQKGSGWLSHVVTDNIYIYIYNIYQTNFVSLNQIPSWKEHMNLRNERDISYRLLLKESWLCLLKVESICSQTF